MAAGKSFVESLESSKNSENLKTGVKAIATAVESLLDKSATSKNRTKEFSYLIFKCGNFNFALPMKVVSEVANSRPIHKLPYKCDKVLNGLVNISGELVITIDILSLLGVGVSKRENCRMIVCALGDDKLAFNADSVFGMARVETSLIKPAKPQERMGGFVENILNINSQFYKLVDFELVAYAITRNYL